MATCKDCIHYEVCKHHAKVFEEDGYEIEFDDTLEVEKRCAAFKPTADVVPKSEGENISQMHPSDEFICEKCGLIIRECCRYEIDEDDGDEICYEFPYRFCPRCGMKVKGESKDA